MATQHTFTEFGLCGIGARICSDGLQRAANPTSKFLNLVVAAFIPATQFRTVTQIRLIGFAGMPTLLIPTLAIGWLMGCKGNEDRKILALTTSLSNVGVGLVIAAGLFPGTTAVSAVLCYGIIEVSGSLLLAMWGGPTGGCESWLPGGAAA
jgi:bile acid:Na+ symporter, BASS family